jgi:hypothetical protein
MVDLKVLSIPRDIIDFLSDAGIKRLCLEMDYSARVPSLQTTANCGK